MFLLQFLKYKLSKPTTRPINEVGVAIMQKLVCFTGLLLTLEEKDNIFIRLQDWWYTDRDTFKGDIAESIQEELLPLLVSILEVLDCLLFVFGPDSLRHRLDRQRHRPYTLEGFIVDCNMVVKE